jgi:hypothetical protein
LQAPASVPRPCPYQSLAQAWLPSLSPRFKNDGRRNKGIEKQNRSMCAHCPRRPCLGRERTGLTTRAPDWQPSCCIHGCGRTRFAFPSAEAETDDSWLTTSSPDIIAALMKTVSTLRVWAMHHDGCTNSGIPAGGFGRIQFNNPFQSCRRPAHRHKPGVSSPWENHRGVGPSRVQHLAVAFKQYRIFRLVPGVLSGLLAVGRSRLPGRLIRTAGI